MLKQVKLTVKAKTLKEAMAKLERIAEIVKEEQTKTKPKPKNKQEETRQFFIDGFFEITKETVTKGEELGLSEEESKHIIRVALMMLREKATESPLK